MLSAPTRRDVTVAAHRRARCPLAARGRAHTRVTASSSSRRLRLVSAEGRVSRAAHARARLSCDRDGRLLRRPRGADPSHRRGDGDVSVYHRWRARGARASAMRRVASTPHRVVSPALRRRAHSARARGGTNLAAAPVCLRGRARATRVPAPRGRTLSRAAATRWWRAPRTARRARRLLPRKTRATVAALLEPMRGLWGQLIPMASMFFWMALANGILDALKDTLVVTAFGGAEQIPYLTVYAVLPMSFVFVGVFAKFSPRGEERRSSTSSSALFDGVLRALHPGALPQRRRAAPDGGRLRARRSLPGGPRGRHRRSSPTGSTRCSTSPPELWGDVILSLLFWGMANETTRLQDASVIYPLLGVGANLAQATSGAHHQVGVRDLGPRRSRGAGVGGQAQVPDDHRRCCGVFIAAARAIMHRAPPPTAASARGGEEGDGACGVRPRGPETSKLAARCGGEETEETEDRSL